MGPWGLPPETVGCATWICILKSQRHGSMLNLARTPDLDRICIIGTPPFWYF